MERYRFALRPRWIISSVLIVILVVTMVNLGFWQLRRLHERRTYNAGVRHNQQEQPVDIGALMHPGDPYSVGHDQNYRQTSATGTYDTSQEIIIRSRSLNDGPGVWIATPLRLADGSAVVVVRGFVPTAGTPDAVPKDAEPPAGPVAITGFVQETQTKALLESSDPPDGHLTDMARVDLARMQKQMPYPLDPAWISLQTQQPAQTTEFPRIVPAPTLDDGPHLSYAIQWFIFSTIAIIGWPLILRRKARDLEREGDDGEGTDGHDELGEPAEPVLSS